MLKIWVVRERKRGGKIYQLQNEMLHYSPEVLELMFQEEVNKSLVRF